jgi:pimeloyl-ACP methyl ester carboxylesterase
MKVTKLTALYLFLSLLSTSVSAQYNFVLVHGAWHGAWTWYELEYELIKAGNTVINIDLPGHGTDTTNPGTVTLTDYQTAIVRVLDSLDSPAILVGHSMGGIAISMAAEARPSKVSKLVYLAAFLLQNDSSMIGAASSDTESMILPALRPNPQKGIIDLDRSYIKDIFYSEATEKYTILSEKLLRPEPLLPIVTPISISDTAYGTVRRFYIETKYDRAITPSKQAQMYTAMPCEEVYTLHSDHSPFFSMAVNLKNVLQKIAKDDNPSKVITATKANLAAAQTNKTNIYLNRNNEVLTITKLQQASKIYLWDLSGRLHYQGNSKTGSVSIDLRGKPAGQYILKIDSPGYTISEMVSYRGSR